MSETKFWLLAILLMGVWFIALLCGFTSFTPVSVWYEGYELRPWLTKLANWTAHAVRFLLLRKKT